MRIILEINDTHIPNSKLIEMDVLDGEVHRSLREVLSFRMCHMVHNKPDLRH